MAVPAPSRCRKATRRSFSKKQAMRQQLGFSWHQARQPPNTPSFQLGSDRDTNLSSAFPFFT
jgi:hypothetical protein